jgi:DNA-binding NtrC family response regulator
VVNIQVPPLRERREDIPLLARSFLERLNLRHHQQKTLSEGLLQALRRQDWPGNVRELENTIEKLYVLTAGSVVEAEGLQSDAQANGSGRAPVASPAAPRISDYVPKSPVTPDEAIRSLVGLPVDEVERRLILATLAQCGGNKSKAARQLQIGLKTLYRKLESYGVPAGE